MSDMTGVELQHELARLGVDVPTILITGRPVDNYRWMCNGLGTVAYLRKPVSEEELIDALKATPGCEEI